MQRRRLCALFVLLACPLAARPQAAPAVPAAFHGRWRVRWPYKERTLEADMELTADGGRWQTFNVASGANACFGRAVRIEVQSATDDALTLQLKFSEVMAGCTNAGVTLQRQADGSLTGTRSGAPLTITRL